MQTKVKWLCRMAPSIGELEDTPKNIWNTQDYQADLDWNTGSPTVFLGLYGFSDFFSLWRHKGRRCIFWAGSDIQHFLNGYFLDDQGKIKIHPTQISSWIDSYCESYVENEVEQAALRSVGIRSKVVPSFLGNVHNYKIEYERNKKPQLYTSVSGNDFKLYGWNKIYKLAQDNPDIEFHLYGNTIPFPLPTAGSLSLFSNIFIHGRVPKEQMNEETKKMQGALRLTEFDGFSEIIAKSLLWGQYPISIIPYPHVLSLDQIGRLKNFKDLNEKGRLWLLSVINKFPWVSE